MSEKELELLEGLENALDEAMVRLCSITVNGPGVVTLGRSIESVNAAVELCKALKAEAEAEAEPKETEP